MSVGDKITFYGFGEMIDNLIDGWIRITGSLNITDQLNVFNESTFGDTVNIVAGVPTLIFDDTHAGHDKYRIRINNDNLVIGAGSPIVDFFTIMANGMNEILLDNANVNITQNLTIGDSIIIDGITIEERGFHTSAGLVNVTGALHIDVDAVNNPGNIMYMIEGAGPATPLIDNPRFVLQTGGPGLASFLTRSFFLMPENDAWLNGSVNNGVITNASGFVDYIGDTQQISFSTDENTTFMYLPGRLQVRDEVYLKNTRGEYRFTTRVLTLIDELFGDLVLNEFNITIVGDNVSLVEQDGENIVKNIDGNETIFNKTQDSFVWNSGTNATPNTNFVFYNQSSTVLEVKITQPTESNAEISQQIIGSNGYGYSGFIDHESQENVINKILNRFKEDGVRYISGFEPIVTSTDVDIGSGTIRVITHLDEQSTVYNSSVNFFYVLSNGTYIQSSSLSTIDEYGDANTISNNKYFNVVFGVIHNDAGTNRLMAVVQDGANEYNNVVDAETDEFFQTNLFPSVLLNKEMFVPVVRVVMKRSGGSTNTIQTLTNDALFIDLRGVVAVSGGSSPSPPITDHNLLNNLEWANASHTFSLSNQVFNIGSYNFTTTGNVTADTFFGDGSQLTGIVSGLWTNESGVATYVGNANLTGNLTMGDKITFRLGEIIDNLVNGVIRITGALNVTDVLILNPQTSPTTSVEGAVFYNDSLDTLMVYNGSQWNGLSGVPQGSMFWFEGSCPLGYTAETNADGRYIVSNSSGTQGVTVGIALGDAENRTVGEHTHTQDAHNHVVNSRAAEGSGSTNNARTGQSGTQTAQTFINSATATNQNTGTAGGTNAPYIQYTLCKKTGQDTLVSNSIWGVSGNNIIIQNTSKNLFVEENILSSGKISSNGSLTFASIDTASTSSYLKFKTDTLFQLRTSNTIDAAAITWFLLNGSNGNLKIGDGLAQKDVKLWVEGGLEVDENLTVTGSINTTGIGGNFLHIQDEKSSGSNGGGVTSGAFRKRVLNTVKTNEISGASVSSDVVSLPAGTYFADWSAPAFFVDQHYTRLQDTSNTVTLVLGSAEFSDNVGGGHTVSRSMGSGRFTLTGTTNIELQHRVGVSQASNGFGVASGVQTNVYSILKIWRIR